MAGERAGSGSGALAPLIGRLGYVQLDSIRVVERAHHHILFSRHGAHRPQHLETLQAKAPALFEHWTHDASLIPLEHYPHWRHRFTKAKTQIARWRERFGDDRVLEDRARPHCGTRPVPGARFRPSGRTHRAVVGLGPGQGGARISVAHAASWRCSNATASKRSTIWPSGPFPGRLRQARPSRAETLDWACSRSPGAAGRRHGQDDRRFLGPCLAFPRRRPGSRAEKKKGRLIDVSLEPAPGKRGFAAVARPDIEAELARLPAAPARLRVLSPFDPVLRDRARYERIFGFDYRIEVFVPAPQAPLWLLRLPPAGGRPLRRPHRHEGRAGQGPARDQGACGWSRRSPSARRAGRSWKPNWRARRGWPGSATSFSPQGPQNRLDRRPMKYSHRFFLYAPVAAIVALAIAVSAYWVTAAQRLFQAAGCAERPRDRARRDASTSPPNPSAAFPSASMRCWRTCASTWRRRTGRRSWTAEHFALHMLDYGRLQLVFEAAGKQTLQLA